MFFGADDFRGGGSPPPPPRKLWKGGGAVHRGGGGSSVGYTVIGLSGLSQGISGIVPGQFWFVLGLMG